ncbi:uncharacterized protein LOC132739495 [Ruditapes philippinarum]|uniref:uncharacterized protein LOC132739495 n=1 Tax=Ruditapes philippinarum TaxID=129788 RepID=UPI00295AFEB7|nr:uncharacterized protein LOC132739495 [Ruditapes philippinarum]
MSIEKSTLDISMKEISNFEISSIFSMESDSYPADEAASFDMLTYRHKEAPDLFLGGYMHGNLVGFICATRYHGKELTHESMNMHIPNGESVCIHSVVVKRNQRRKGIALQMLKLFIENVKSEQANVTGILLICKSNLIPLYTKAGFELVGKSHVVHGKDPWYELKISLT